MSIQSNETFKLRVLIIGGGLGGLAAAISTCLEGHNVTILESAQELGEIGAGLQITPNATRLLSKWGVFDELTSKAAVPTTCSVHRYDGTKLLAHDAHFQETIMRRCGFPCWNMHRVDLHHSLAQRAVALGARVKLSARVVGIDFDIPKVTLQSGEELTGDVVVAADGLWSSSRSLFLGRPVLPKLTGDLAYRIVLELKDIDDPELREWVANPAVHYWFGPHSHVVGYSLRGGEIYNMVLLCPDDLPEGVRKSEGNIGEMNNLFQNWDPVQVPLEIS